MNGVYSTETPLQVSINGAGRQLVGHGYEVEIHAAVVDVDETSEQMNYNWICSQDGEEWSLTPGDALIHVPTASGKDEGF